MSRFRKPLPGTPLNYADPLCPLSRNLVGSDRLTGAVLPLNEGSGTPRLYLGGHQLTTASSGTDRLCSKTSFEWSGYQSKNFGGPTMHRTATNGLLNCGVHADFLPLDAGTIVVGYKKTDSANNVLVSTSTSTLSQIILVDIYGAGKADFLWGGATEGTNQLTSGTGFPLGDDVWAFSTGPRGMEIWQNGSLIASNTASPSRTATSHDFQLGTHAFWGSSEVGEYSFVYVYPIQLSRSEISQISNDPFCFYDWGEDELLLTTITPGSAAIAITTYAPTVLTPLIPFSANLVLTTYAPTVNINASNPVITGSLLQIDWNDDGDFNDFGEDVTPRLISEQPMTCVRGKDQLRLLAPPMAGAFNCELDNRSRDYSVENSSSPLFTNLHPGHKIRATLTALGSDYTIFTGILDDLVQHPEFGKWTVETPALGSLSRLRGKRISTELLENVTIDEAMNAVLDAAGWPALERSLQVGLTTLDFYVADNEDAFDAIATLLLTEGPGASVYENQSGYFIFENRHSRVTQVASTTSQFTFSDQAYLAMPYQYDSGIKDIINQVEVGVTTRTVKEESFVWEYGKPLILGPSETRVLRAVANDWFKDAQTPDPNSGRNEIHTITIIGTAPQIRLSFRDEQTGDIGSTGGGPTAAAIQTALEGLGTIGPGNITVVQTGSAPDFRKFDVTWQGDFEHMPVELLGLSVISLSGKAIEGKVVEKQLGIVDDYDLLAGSVVFTLSATSGASIEIEAAAGGGGAYVANLQMRAKLVSTDSTKRFINTLDANNSIAKYGLHPYSPSIRTEFTEEQAIQLADNIVRYYSDPRPTVVFSVAGVDGTIQLQQLTRQISDRITIVDGQTGVNTDFFIERIAHRITEGPNIYTEFGCERVLTGTIGGPGGGGGDVAIVGSAIVGTSTVGA